MAPHLCESIYSSVKCAGSVSEGPEGGVQWFTNGGNSTWKWVGRSVTPKRDALPLSNEAAWLSHTNAKPLLTAFQCPLFCELLWSVDYTCAMWRCACCFLAKGMWRKEQWEAEAQLSRCSLVGMYPPRGTGAIFYSTGRIHRRWSLPWEGYPFIICLLSRGNLLKTD